MSFSIQTVAGEWYYSLFYHLSILSFFLIYLIYGIVKKYPLISWSLIGLCGIISFMIGSRIGAMDRNQLLDFLTTSRLPSPPGQTDILGILIGLVGIVVAKNFLGFKKPVFAVFAFAVPVAIIVQRSGCLAAGCCFGSITDFPISVQYATHFRLFQHQVEQGFASPSSDLSLPVHAVPIYIMIAAFLTLLLITRIRNRIKQELSLLLLSIACLLSLRFMIEFLRDPITNHAMGDFFWGLKIIQWLLLGVVAVTIPVIWILEKSASGTSMKISREISHRDLRKWILFFGIIGLIAYTNQLFAVRDLVNIFLIIALSGSIILIYSAPHIIRNPVHLTSLLLSLGSLLWMSQTIANDRKVNPDSTSVAAHIKEVKQWIQAGAFIANPTGDFREYRGSGCDAVLINHEKFEGQYAGGLWYEQSVHHKPGRHALFGFGTNLSRYKVTPILHSGANITNQGSFSIGLYFGGDRENFGYKIGGYLGDLKVISAQSNEVVKTAFLPFFQLRAGDQNRIYGQFGLLDDIHQGPFATLNRSFLGINLNSPGALNQSILKLGAVNILSKGNTRLYLGGKFDLNKSLYFTPDFQFGESFSYGLGLGMNIR